MTLLATVAELADHLHTTISLDDPTAVQALEGATGACVDYCPGHSFFPVEGEVAQFRGDGTDTLVLRKPLVEVTTVTLDGVELTAETDYYVTSAGNLRRPWSRVWTLGKVIAVTYSYGDAEVPAAARLACLQEAAEVYRPTSSTTAPVGSADYTSETVMIDDYTHSYTRGVGAAVATRPLSATSRSLLEPFRVQSVA